VTEPHWRSEPHAVHWTGVTGNGGSVVVVLVATEVGEEAVEVGWFDADEFLAAGVHAPSRQATATATASIRASAVPR
jgi:hypothetical protein